MLWLGDKSEDLDISEFPEVLQEFDKVKEIMEEEDVSGEKALDLLEERKGSSALDDFSPEAREAFLGLVTGKGLDEEE